VSIKNPRYLCGKQLDKIYPARGRKKAKRWQKSFDCQTTRNKKESQA